MVCVAGVQETRDQASECNSVGCVNYQPAEGKHRARGAQSGVLVLPAARTLGEFSWWAWPGLPPAVSGGTDSPRTPRLPLRSHNAHALWLQVSYHPSPWLDKVWDNRFRASNPLPGNEPQRKPSASASCVGSRVRHVRSPECPSRHHQGPSRLCQFPWPRLAPQDTGFCPGTEQHRGATRSSSSRRLRLEKVPTREGPSLASI